MTTPASTTIDPFARTRQALEAATADGGGLGLALVARRHGEIIVEHATGLSRRQPARPVDETTQWLVASITKPVAAAAIMLLVERGQLSLDQPVADVLPDFGANGKDRVTLRHLLTHTSGLDESFQQRLTPDQFGTDAAFEALCQTSLLWPPGSRAAYNNTAYALLGILIERVAGEPHPSFIHREILAPLGMTDSALAVPLASLHGRLAEVEAVDPPLVHLLVETGNLAGGLVSTARNIATFGQCFLDGGRGLLAPASLAAMTRDHAAGLEEDEGERGWRPAAGRGLAWRLNLRLPPDFCDLASPAAFGHGGATGTLLLIDPAYGLVIALMANRWGWGGPARARILNTVYAALRP